MKSSEIQGQMPLAVYNQITFLREQQTFLLHQQMVQVALLVTAGNTELQARVLISRLVRSYRYERTKL